MIPSKKGYSKKIKLYDTDGTTLMGYLENAYAKTYSKKLNDIWEASFSLPADDPKTLLCKPYRVVELFDGDTRIDKFRILPTTHISGERGEVITYECEHVLATLVDDLMFQHHERIGYDTDEVIEYILAFQETTRWVLGSVNFTKEYAYKWESENLLNAILSITKVFSEDFQWTWDTTVYPWVLNLVITSPIVTTEVTYGHNLKSITKETDPADLCTRLYCLGFGSGNNQLLIDEVNGGVSYLDADTQPTYGVISKIYTDTTEENAETLMAKAEAMLEKLKYPKVSYKFDAVHLSKITNNTLDDFHIGGYCEVTDKDDRLHMIARVIEISKPDIDGSPGNINIVISDKADDISNDISSLVDKSRVAEVYDQGSVMIDTQNFSANLSYANPVSLKFYIPEDAVRINKVELSYESVGYETYLLPYTEASGGTNHLHMISKGLWKGSHDAFYMIQINSVALPAGDVGVSGDSIDIAPYLVGMDGKIERGVWHEVKFFSNTIARVSAQVITKMFIQSRGGGDY